MEIVEITIDKEVFVNIRENGLRNLVFEKEILAKRGDILEISENEEVWNFTGRKLKANVSRVKSSELVGLLSGKMQIYFCNVRDLL